MKKNLFRGMISLIVLIGCGKDENIEDAIFNNSSNNDSLGAAKTEEAEKTEIKYTTYFLTEKNKDSLFKKFDSLYTKDQMYSILALNRLDQANRWRADTLVIPSLIDSTLMAYSPFPKHIALLKDVKKFVTFSYPIQAYGVYSNGKLVKWGPTSMGKKVAKTKTGLMFTNWKKELAISTVNKSWKLPYNFNVHNTLGIGWHQYDLPGYPASHSCLRLLMDDAKWMYSYADQWILSKGGATIRAKGTPVLIFGEYGWGKAKPWKHLEENPKGMDISEEELTELLNPHLQMILLEQSNREKVLQELAVEKEKAIVKSALIPEKSAE